MVRPAQKQDASRIAEILIFAKRMAYRPIFKNDFVSFCEMQVLELALEYRNSQDMLKDVYVYDDGIVKGMMSLECSSFPNWQLKELYIDPFFQKQGIGFHMISYLLAIAEQNHVKEVFLWVLEENRFARQFYERHGFFFEGTRKLEPGTEAFLLKYMKKLSCMDRGHED